MAAAATCARGKLEGWRPSTPAAAAAAAAAASSCTTPPTAVNDVSPSSSDPDASRSPPPLCRRRRGRRPRRTRVALVGGIEVAQRRGARRRVSRRRAGSWVRRAVRWVRRGGPLPSSLAPLSSPPPPLRPRDGAAAEVAVRQTKLLEAWGCRCCTRRSRRDAHPRRRSDTWSLPSRRRRCRSARACTATRRSGTRATGSKSAVATPTALASARRRAPHR